MTTWGMRPVTVPEAPSALKALYQALDEEDPFSIAVIDSKMPGMSGEALGRAIKADPRLGDMKMVMLTSLGRRGNTQLYEEIGFAGYTNKPVRHSNFFNILSCVLSATPGCEGQPILTRLSAREQITPFADGGRILLAEDNTTNQLVAMGILNKLGLSADAVADGEEVIQSLTTIPYDVVLMDVHMPLMDGYQATREIRDPESKVLNHKIPIIAMTANAMIGDREKCLEAGMDDYVSKPVSPRALADVLAKWLPDPKESGITQQFDLSGDSADTPIIQPAVFDRDSMVARLMHDKDLISLVVKSFLEDIPRQISTLKETLESGDSSEVERLCHTIKGASSNVGGELLRAVAAEMEKYGKADDLASVKEKVDELEEQFSLLKGKLEEIVRIGIWRDDDDDIIKQ